MGYLQQKIHYFICMLLCSRTTDNEQSFWDLNNNIRCSLVDLKQFASSTVKVQTGSSRGLKTFDVLFLQQARKSKRIFVTIPDFIDIFLLKFEIKQIFPNSNNDLFHVTRNHANRLVVWRTPFTGRKYGIKRTS